MSYAKAAASSGPIGAEPLPQPPVHPEQHPADAETTEDINEFNDADVDELKTGVKNDLVKNAKAAKQETNDTKKDIKQDAKEIKKDVKQGAKDVKTEVKKDAKVAGKAAEDIKEDVKKDAKAAGKAAEEFKEDAKKVVSEKASQVKEGAADLAKDVKKKVNKEAKDLPQNAEELKKDAHKLANKAYSKGKEIAQEGQDALHQFAEDHEDEIKEFEERTKSLWELVVAHTTKAVEQVSNFVSAKSQCASNQATKAVVNTKRELQNPAVVGQIGVAVAAAAAGYITFVERKHRINTNSKTVLGVHASVVTGLILLDAFVFKRAYNRYDKKLDKNL